jgi:hypothetical protein
VASLPLLAPAPYAKTRPMIIAIAFLITALLAHSEVPESLADIPPDFPSIGFTLNPSYSAIGLHFGSILNVRRERPVLSTYEGELMMGLGSNPGPKEDRVCAQSRMDSIRQRTGNQQEQNALAKSSATDCLLFKNPWRFSFLNDELYSRMISVKERPVLIYYITHLFSFSHILMRTRNHVQQVFPIMPNLKIEPHFQISSWSQFHPESGHITGRIVGASSVNVLIKSYEVIIQEGENASNFRAMSISDGDLFRYITRAMLTGKRLRIEYVRLFGLHAQTVAFFWNYLTEYRVIAVDVIDQ